MSFCNGSVTFQACSGAIKFLENIFLIFFTNNAGGEIDEENEEGKGISLGTPQLPWEGTDRDYKYEEVSLVLTF